MDFDLEIINEEGDCPDPLFNSIMNAMNSMKEATADKIYQKIQKEGETNYSKPQVDRALANALKYGIFEVRNNRYRVRDNILDDEDTVYWKLQNKREQTPFRIQEGTNDKHLGPALDPEKDNRRFRRIKQGKESSKESRECPNCGRIKKPVIEDKKDKSCKKTYHGMTRQKNEKTNRDIKKRDNLRRKEDTAKRKRHADPLCKESAKKRNTKMSRNIEFHDIDHENESIEYLLFNNKNLPSKKMPLETNSDIVIKRITEHRFDSSSVVESENRGNNQSQPTRTSNSPVYEKTDRDFLKKKRSSISIKSESDSEKTFMSSVSDDQSQSKIVDPFFESLPCTSRNANTRPRNLSEMYNDQYKNSQTEQGKEKSDWLGCTDEPQGTIIQSDNVLTIEPMDSLAFKSPEHASYIS